MKGATKEALAVIPLFCVMLSAGGLTAPSMEAASTGLVAAYNFEEGAGSTTVDASGNTHTGTLTNGPTWAVGKFGNALNFDGVNDYVLMGNPSTLNFGSADFSFAAWVKRGATGAEHNIFSKTASGSWTSGGKEFFISSSNNTLAFGGYGSVGEVHSSGTITNDGNWHHVAVTFVKSSNAVKLYLDGIQTGSATLPLPVDGSTHVVKIGSNAGMNSFKGLIDDVRIYNRALSQLEIQADMNTPVGTSSSDTTPPLRSNGQPSGTLPSGTTQATLSLVTNENASCRYSVTPQLSYASMSNAFTVSGGTAHSTVISGLTDSTPYTFYARCQDGSGNANGDDFPISFTVAAPALPDIQPPSVPTGLTAIAISTSQINLSWNASTDNIGVAGYRVYRDGAQVGTSATTSYSDGLLGAGTTYAYTIDAFDAAGNVSGQSQSVSTTTPVSQPTQATLYVSPSGSDTNPGTEDQPFLTIDRARSAVRTMNASMNGDIIVYLRGGEYQFTDTVTFDATDSGTNGFNVIYTAYPGEHPVISGGKAISEWTAVGGGLYKATVPAGLRFRQLYVNGQRAIRARTPNVGAFYRLISWDTAGQQIRVNPGEVGTWQDLTEVEMVVQKHWQQNNFRIAAVVTAGQSTYVVPREPERSRAFAWGALLEANQVYYFENALEFLDAPGEWYLRTTTNELFYLPRPGEDMATAVVMAPQLTNILRLQGTLDQPIHHIQFFGLTFEGSNWLVPSNEGFLQDQAVGYANSLTPPGEDELTSYPVGRIDGGVYLEAADHIRFERNVFQHMGGDALIFYGAAHNNAVIGNRVQDIAADGIVLDETFEGNPTDPRKISTNNTVSNNYVTGVGRDYSGAVGIFAGYSDSGVFEHNEVTDAPYSGISVGWGWSLQANAAQNNSIRYNHIWNVMNRVDDGGGIYTLSRQPGTVIADNYIHDLVRAPAAQSYPIGGVYLDEGSDAITVRDNVIQNVPTRVHLHTGGSQNTLTNNNAYSATTVANAGLEPAYQDIRPSPSDTTPPLRSNGQPSETLPSGTTQATLSLATDENATCRYSLTPQLPYASMPSAFTLTGGPTHSTVISNLTDSTPYTFYVRCQDGSGNVNGDDFPISFSVAAPALPDTTPPTVAITTPTTSPTYSTGSTPLTLMGTAGDDVGVTQVTWANDRGGSGTATGTMTWAASGIALQAGINALSVTARDAAGNIQIASLTVTYNPPETTPPTGFISINADATYTNSTGVTLNLTATDAVGVTGYYVSTSPNAPSPTAAGWVSVPATVSYSGNVPYTLSGGDGSKTVHAWYKDAAGNVSDTASYSIILDQTPPGGGILSATAQDTQVTLAWSGISDGTSGLSSSTPYKLVYRTGSLPSALCTDGTQLLLGTGAGFVHTGLTNGTTYFYRVCALDNAGNTSSGATASATPSTADTTNPTGTVTINGNSDYTSTTAVALHLSASDALAVTGYYLSTSSATPSGSTPGWVAVAATTSFISDVPYTLTGGDGTKTVYSWYKDAAGNVSDTASDLILLDQTPPSNGTLGATPGNAQVVLSWSGTADAGSGLASANTYKLVFMTGGSPNGTCTSGTQLLLGTATSYTHTGLTNGTTYFYRVCAFDNAGNTSTGATASATPNVAPAPSTGLVAAFSFDASSGTSVTDASGNGHTGTLVNGPVWTAGRYGNAVSFDGVNDYVNVANPGTMNFGTSDFSFTAWAKRGATGAKHTIFSKTASGSWGSRGKEFFISGTDNTLAFRGYGSVGEVHSSGGIPDDGNWHHVAVTFVNSSNAVTLYIDGIPSGSGTLSLPADRSTHVVRIGTSARMNYLKGLIDDVRIYNRALGQVEIQNLMTTPVIP